MQPLHKRPLSSPSGSYDCSHSKRRLKLGYIPYSERGLTLIEVLLTTALLSMGLLAVANMQMVSMRVNASSAKLTEATLTTQEIVERIMSLPFNHALLTDDYPQEPGVATTHTYPDPPEEYGYPELPAGYSIHWEVDTKSANDKTVNLVTTWGSLENQKTLSIPLQISTYTNPE